MKWLAFLLILLCITSVYSLEVYIRPPRMIARVNLTETNEWKGFIEVMNKNDQVVNVTFKPVGNITQMIKITDQVELKPGELRQENFTLTVKSPGTYQGGLIVTYIKEGEVPVALQADIIVIVSGKIEEKNTIPYLYFLFPILALTGIVLYKRWKK